MTKTRIILGRFHQRKDGGRFINIGKGLELPFENRQQLKITKKGRGIVITPVT